MLLLVHIHRHGHRHRVYVCLCYRLILNKTFGIYVKPFKDEYQINQPKTII